MKEYDYKAIPAPSGEKICLTLPGPCYDKERRVKDV